MSVESRFTTAVVSLAALVIPAQALAAGEVPSLPVPSPVAPPELPVTVSPGIDGNGAAVDVGAGDTVLHASAGPGGVSVGTRPKAPGSTGGGGAGDPGAPIGNPGDRKGQTPGAGVGGGPAPVFFAPASSGRRSAAAPAGDRRQGPGRSRPENQARRRGAAVGAAPSDTDATRGLGPFLQFVERIPTAVKVGVVALALIALAMWAAWVRQRRRLERNAFVDPVTGIANAPAFHGILAGELDRARRYKRPLALLVLDVSDADRRLPLLRDQALRDVVEAIREPLRQGDILARLGAARFAVISPEATKASAETLRRALERRIEEMRLHSSAGTAERLATDFEPDDLLARAEAAMAEPETRSDRIRKRAVLRAA